MLFVSTHCSDVSEIQTSQPSKLPLGPPHTLSLSLSPYTLIYICIHTVLGVLGSKYLTQQIIQFKTSRMVIYHTRHIISYRPHLHPALPLLHHPIDAALGILEQLFHHLQSPPSPEISAVNRMVDASEHRFQG